MRPVVPYEPDATNICHMVGDLDLVTMPRLGRLGTWPSKRGTDSPDKPALRGTMAPDLSGQEADALRAQADVDGGDAGDAIVKGIALPRAWRHESEDGPAP